VPKKILIADDDYGFVTKCRTLLEWHGYGVTHVSSRGTLFDELQKTPPQLVIIGHLVPGITAYEIYRILRSSRFSRMKTLIHAARAPDQPEQVQIHASIGKVFDDTELLQHVRTIIGGSRPSNGIAPLAKGPILLDPKGQSVTIDTKEILLTRIEFRLLYQLALHFGTTVPRLELSRKVWGGRIAHEALLTVYIMKLRKKIEAKGTDRIRIVTEHGSGYRLECKQKKVVSD